MLSWQSNQNGMSRLGFNTETGKFEVSIDLTSGKYIRRKFLTYKHAIRVLKKYRRKYKLD